MYVFPFSLLSFSACLEVEADEYGWIGRARFCSSSRRILNISKNLRNGRGLLRGLRQGVGISIRLLLYRRNLKS